MKMDIKNTSLYVDIKWPNAKRLYKSKIDNYICIELNTFCFSWDPYTVSNSDKFSTKYACGSHNIYHVVNRFLLSISPHAIELIYLNTPITNREERIKILADELLFCKRRKELTKAARIYKKNKKRKILKEMNNYLPIDLCKTIEEYIWKKDPEINCKWNKN